MVTDRKKNQKKICSLAPIWRNNSVRHGFSLIEVLFTLLILTLTIAGVTFLMTKNITSVQDSKNQIISAMLAQEGVELVRNLKDNETLPLACNNCRISREMNNINNSSVNRLNLVGGFYQHGGGMPTATKFYRRIDVSTALVGATNETTVTSYVTWNNVGFNGMSLPAGCTTGNKCVSAVSVMPDLY